MLNKALLDTEVSEFIKEHQKKDLPALILKGSPFKNITIQELAVQIQGLKIAEKKFPELYQNKAILYPPKLNLEQTSSQITAKYKASLIKGEFGIDLTGGLGVDSYFISQNFKKFSYCELNPELAEIAEYNFNILGAENISVNTGDGLSILKESDEKFDWIYVDPARRDNHGGKVFRFEDCEPNIPANLKLLFKNTEHIMIKSSPLLDITAGLSELKFVKEVHIVAVRNEVKELLWILEKDYAQKAMVKTINFEKNKIQEFSGKFGNEPIDIQFGLPENYLYEPNAAIMKSGLFDLLAFETKTKKLHQHSHLYTSDKKDKFPGRIFQVTGIKNYKPSDLKKHFKSKKANITTRNFPESVESIRKKFKIKEGGSDYIFFTTNKNGDKIVIFCKKD